MIYEGYSDPHQHLANEMNFSVCGHFIGSIKPFIAREAPCRKRICKNGAKVGEVALPRAINQPKMSSVRPQTVCSALTRMNRAGICSPTRRLAYHVKDVKFSPLDFQVKERHNEITSADGSIITVGLSNEKGMQLSSLERRNLR